MVVIPGKPPVDQHGEISTNALRNRPYKKADSGVPNMQHMAVVRDFRVP